MNKNKNFSQGNKYEFIDGFKCFFFLVIIIVALSVLLNMIFSVIANSMNVSLETFNSYPIATIITLLASPVAFIIYYFVYNKVRKVNNKFAMSDGQKISLLPISTSMVLAIISIFLFTPFMNLIQYWFMSIGYIPDNSLPLQAEMSSNMSFLLIGVILYALLPAIAEEIVFRGIIQKSLSTKLNGFGTILLTTLMFVMVHGSLQQTVYQFLVGIMLSYVVYVGGSVIYGIILHFLNNLFVLVFSCFDFVGYLSADETVYYNIFSQIFPFMLFLLGLVLTGILFWVLKYLRNKNFFRVDSKGRRKKVKAKDMIDLDAPEKIRIRDIWKNCSYIEKVFVLSSLSVALFVWVINTISGFIA